MPVCTDLLVLLSTPRAGCSPAGRRRHGRLPGGPSLERFRTFERLDPYHDPVFSVTSKEPEKTGGHGEIRVTPVVTVPVDFYSCSALRLAVTVWLCLTGCQWRNSCGASLKGPNPPTPSPESRPRELQGRSGHDRRVDDSETAESSGHCSPNLNLNLKSMVTVLITRTVKTAA